MNHSAGKLERPLGDLCLYNLPGNKFIENLASFTIGSVLDYSWFVRSGQFLELVENSDEGLDRAAGTVQTKNESCPKFSLDPFGSVSE